MLQQHWDYGLYGTFSEFIKPTFGFGSYIICCPHITNNELDTTTSLEELQQVLKQAKQNKAPGPNQIPVEFYKNAPDEYLIKLVEIFNWIFDTGNVPQSFRASIVFPLHKKGNMNDANNYRGISFMDVDSKLFTGILLNRLTYWMDKYKILREFQAGFRKNYSTIDNIFILNSIINLKLIDKRRKLYGFFVDLKSAFDHVDREGLFYKLYNYGVSSKFVNILRKLYKDTKAGVWHKEGISESFETNIGLKQGCLLSPALFSLFLNDLELNLGGGD